MKQVIKSTLLVTLLACALSAQATNFGDTNTTNNTTNTTNTTNQGGAGGAGGSANSLNTNSANVLGSGNSNTDVSSKNYNTNTAAQQQTSKSNAQQSQTQQANNSGVTTSVAVQGDSVTYEAQKRDPVATAYSNLAAPSAPCMGSSSGGVQTVAVGVSFGTTWTSEGCNDREDIRVASLYGDKDVAEQMIVDKIKGYAAAKEKVEARRAQQAKTAPKVSQLTPVTPPLTLPAGAAGRSSRYSEAEVAAAKASLGL
jgi:hypothetical protein